MDAFNYLSAGDKEDIVEDFFEQFGDLIGLEWEGFGDEDTEFTIVDFDEKDTQIRAYTKEDKDDHNWEIKVFAKVLYQDLDEFYETGESDKEYVVISTTLVDEGEYDELTMEEVDRRFDF